MQRARHHSRTLRALRSWHDSAPSSIRLRPWALSSWTSRACLPCNTSFSIALSGSDVDSNHDSRQQRLPWDSSGWRGTQVLVSGYPVARSRTPWTVLPRTLNQRADSRGLKVRGCLPRYRLRTTLCGRLRRLLGRLEAKDRGQRGTLTLGCVKVGEAHRSPRDQFLSTPPSRLSGSGRYEGCGV